MFSHAEVSHAKAIMETCGPTYLWATRFFPRHIRNSVYVLYGFVRLADDLVDTTAPHAQRLADITIFIDGWNARDTNSPYALTYSSMDTLCQHYDIPSEWVDAFLSAMVQDTQDTVYHTYADLEQYMYGSAAVIGLMMTKILGYTDPKALQYAQDLGYAMQLTNFLRDIREDRDIYGRIYLPQETLDEYGITCQDIENHTYPKNWNAAIELLAKKCDDMYANAKKGEPYLVRGRWVIRLANILYASYLTKIRHSGYRVYDSSYKLSVWHKLKYTFSSLF